MKRFFLVLVLFLGSMSIGSSNIKAVEQEVKCVTLGIKCKGNGGVVYTAICGRTQMEMLQELTDVAEVVCTH